MILFAIYWSLSIVWFIIGLNDFKWLELRVSRVWFNRNKFSVPPKKQKHVTTHAQNSYKIMYEGMWWRTYSITQNSYKLMFEAMWCRKNSIKWELYGLLFIEIFFFWVINEPQNVLFIFLNNNWCLFLTLTFAQFFERTSCKKDEVGRTNRIVEFKASLLVAIYLCSHYGIVFVLNPIARGCFH